MATSGPDRWFFDYWSLGYDLELPQRLVYRPVHEAVLRNLRGQHKRRRILDVGCGTGELLGRLRGAFPRDEVIGCDFSAGMLQHAAAKRKAQRLVCGDAGRLPFRDASIDVITSTEAFHWFPDQHQALREFRRVLVPGGRLLLALVTPLRLFSRLAQVGSVLSGQPFYWPTQAETRRKLQKAGFEVETQERIFRFPGLGLQPMLTTAVATGGRRARPAQEKRESLAHQMN
jgi:demethylmenaquinone methyltransferase/2-methoxy-6-polyprenyl-1,4-benzoquinol methylase